MFQEKAPWIVCDNMPFIHLMSCSREIEIQEELIKAIRGPRLNHPIGDIRDILQCIFTRVRESLKTNRLQQ